MVRHLGHEHLLEALDHKPLNMPGPSIKANVNRIRGWTDMQSVIIAETFQEVDDQLNALQKPAGSAAVVPPVIPADQIKVHTFGWGGDIPVGASATPKIRIATKEVCQYWSITANVAPGGASIIVDIKNNGVSIFPGGTANEVVLPATQLIAIGMSFLGSPATPPILQIGDLLIPDVIQVGASPPGFRVQIELVCKLMT